MQAVMFPASRKAGLKDFHLERKFWQITPITPIKDKRHILLAQNELNCRGMNPGLIEVQGRDQSSEHQMALCHH